MKIVAQYPLSSIRFRSLSGQRVIDLYQQINVVLSRHLVSQYPEIRVLFARPVIDRRKGVIDWVSDLAGRSIQSFEDLEEAKKNKVLKRLEELLVAVSGLQQTGNIGGDIFSALASIPATNDIFLVDDQIVLASWGCEKTSGENIPANLFNAVAPDLVPEAAVVPEIPADVVQKMQQEEPQKEVVRIREHRGWPFLWFLFLLFLLLFLLLFGLRGCAQFGLGAPFPNLGGLVPPVNVAIPQLQLDREVALRADIANLGSRLSDAVGACSVAEAENSSVDDRLAAHDSSVGVVNVSLTWNNRHDLDLVVEDPEGERIFFRNKNASSGGFLDIDMNARAGSRNGQPIENIKWENESPPTGLYKVYVAYYQQDSADVAIDPTPFEVVVTVRGQREIINGSISSSEHRKSVFVHQFTVE